VHPAGILPFADLVSLLRVATVFLSGDCGPMHLGPALGIATVAVFLVSDAAKYRPLGPDDVALDQRDGPMTVQRVVDAVTATVPRALATRKKHADIIAAHTGSGVTEQNDTIS
jgi:ADP-heptose:LPS heptosyltransferase